MFGIGMPELILILVVALIVIGPKKLPDMAKSLGKALNEFKSATQEFKDSIDTEVKDFKSLDKKDIGRIGKRYQENSAEREADQPQTTGESTSPENVTQSEEPVKTGVPEYDDPTPAELKDNAKPND